MNEERVAHELEGGLRPPGQAGQGLERGGALKLILERNSSVVECTQAREDVRTIDPPAVRPTAGPSWDQSAADIALEGLHRCVEISLRRTELTGAQRTVLEICRTLGERYYANRDPLLFGSTEYVRRLLERWLTPKQNPRSPAAETRFTTVPHMRQAVLAYTSGPIDPVLPVVDIDMRQTCNNE